MDVYINPYNDYRFTYARPFGTKIAGPLEKSVMKHGRSVQVIFYGVPNGVDPKTYKTLVSKNVPKRLFLFSNEPLDDEEIAVADELIGQSSLPIVTAESAACAGLPAGGVPLENFYLCQRVPDTNTGYYEYRYLYNRYTR